MVQLLNGFSCVLLGIMALTLGSAPVAAAEPTNPDLSDLSLEELMNVTVSTASKKEQKVAEATSVISVISRKDIDASGAITLYDVLKRVPGFFPTRQATWQLITARGLPSDATDHILLLIDGHPQNSIIGQGFQQQDQIPTLDKVERVEIIRGPGSVLWGSSATLGIINIITRDTVEQSKLTFEAQSGQQLQYASFLGGFGDGKDVKGMYSIAAWAARGYRYEQDQQYAVAFPWGAAPGDTWFAQWPYMDKQRSGFELYGKVKYKDDTELYARILKTSFNYVWDEWATFNANEPHEMGNRRAYVGVKRRFKVSEDLKFEADLYGDYNLQNRDPLELFNPHDTTLAQDQTNEEFAIGAELLSTIQVLSTNSLKIGLKYVRTEIGPNRDARLDPITNTPVASGSGTQTGSGTPFTYSLSYYGVDPGIDNSAAVYAEDSQQLGPVTLFVGGRFDWNDYRKQGAQLLPRAGLIYRLTEALVTKYTFNTGYLRPEAVYSKTQGTIVDSSRGGAFPIGRVTDAESVQSHDLQFSYTHEGTVAALTFFYMNVDNFISFDANDTPQGYRNIGDAKSYGAELEAKQAIRSFLLIDGNVSLARGHISDTSYQGALSDTNDRTLNYPTLIANLGVDVHPLERHTFNTNVRMWTDMRYVKAKDQLNPGDASTTYGTLGPEFYLDLNYEIKDLGLKGLDFNAFASNLLDNQDRIGMVVNNGTYRPIGRTLGARLAYNF